MKRRDFIKNVLGAGTMGMLGLSAKPMFAASPSFSDYKAMVCILLDGGNDAWNTFVPKGSSGNTHHTSRRPLDSLTHLKKLINGSLDNAFALRVQRGRCLVQQENLGLLQKRAADTHV